jgi:hypothetical protein
MNSAELYSRTRRQLLAQAKSAAIVGRHRMTKEQLSHILAAWYSAIPVGRETGDLPASYGRSHLTLLEINPSLAHAFWELTPEDSGAAWIQLAAESPAAAWTVRLHSCGADDEFFDVEIDPAPGNWYVHHSFNGMACWAEIGLRVPSGQFIPVCRSNSIGTPGREPLESSGSQRLSVDEQSIERVPDPTASCGVTPDRTVTSSPPESENPQSAIRNPQSGNSQSGISNRQPPVSMPQSMVSSPQSTISNRQSAIGNRKSAIRNPQSEQPVSSFGCGLRPPAGHPGKA